MKVQKLWLTDFRNYTSAEVNFSDGINILYGENAQGKTNLLEALWLFTAAKSFRTQTDGEMISFEKESAFIKSAFFAYGRENTCEIELKSGKRKIIKVNGSMLEKTSALLGIFPAVVFSPDELHIINGAPEGRRRFIDSAISSRKPAYYDALRTYLRAWKQKNALLKKNPQKETLTVWNEQMAESGSRLMRYRQNFFKNLAPICAALHREIAKEEELEVRYEPSVPMAENAEDQKERLFSAFEKKQDAEIYAGLSLIGPHRDEMRFFINHKSARAFASQGQQRTAAVVLKAAQAELLYRETGEQPLVLLDDVMGELDAKRRAFLLENMQMRQTVLTCTEKEDLLLAGARFFKVEGGNVCIST